MKPIYFITILVISSLYSLGQNNYSDVIYPVPGVDSITNCYIIEIRKWNTIIFEKNNNQDTVDAIAVVKKGRFIDFRTREEIKNNAYPILNTGKTGEQQVNDYKYYEFKYKNTLHAKRTGAVLSILGAACGLTSLYLIEDESQVNGLYTSILFFSGGFLFNLGTPIWISNSIKAKKNKEAMLKQQQKDYSLNMGMTNNGIGLIIKF